MADAPKMPPVKGGIKQLTDEDLKGYAITELNCRGCSGYGNCGFRSYRLYNGKAVALCVARMEELMGDEAPRP